MNQFPTNEMSPDEMFRMAEEQISNITALWNMAKDALADDNPVKNAEVIAKTDEYDAKLREWEDMVNEM